MATYDLTKGGAVGYPAVKKGGTFRIAATVDFNENNYVATDVLKLINVPAMTVVENVSYEVQTAEGAILTFDIGDNALVTAYITAADGNALGWDANVTPAKEAAVESINLRINNNAAAAKITVVAFLRDCSSAA